MEQSSRKHTTPAVPGTVLLLQVPRTNGQKELAAEQMFASLHGLLSMPITKTSFFGPTLKRETISFEIAVLKRRIGFYVWVPDYIKGFVEEQIYAQYPTVQISEVPDYATAENDFPTTLTAVLKLSANEALPIKTFQNFDVDPLAAITATLAKFGDDEEAWIQLLIKPAESGWQRKSEQYITELHSGKPSLLSIVWQPTPNAKTTPNQLSEHNRLRVTNAEAKSQKLSFSTQILIVYRGHIGEEQARLRLQSIIASYKQFNTTYLNGFTVKRITTGGPLLASYQARRMLQSGLGLNIEEVATLYHLPHTNVQTPYILWANSQTAEPPANLPVQTADTGPDDLSPIAVTNFRDHSTVFGMPRSDRSRHLYIIGQTGVGKSGLLELLSISDIQSSHGFAIIDPHGDYAQSVLHRIPPERQDDVIYFNPADTAFPVAFNPIEVVDPQLKMHTVSELIGVLKRMFESWGPRLEYILRYCLLALLDYPQATMLDITRLLTDVHFRRKVMEHVTDPVVRNFWLVEFASWNDRFAAEAIAPVLNKVGAFTANPLVRNIIGQPKSSFNVRQIMDERKILIANLAHGLIGEDNAALLGSLLVTKIQLAAMSRANTPEAARVPFYLYVDEFQNFATDSFVTILSEARKYGLNLTVANQYIAQMPPNVKDAVFGNVGSLIAFRMGADDAKGLLRYLTPTFEEYDLIHLHNRHFIISMTIEGEKAAGFSGISLSLPPPGESNIGHIIEHSRERYAAPREDVERFIHNRYVETKPKKQEDRLAPAKVVAPSAKPKPAKTIRQPGALGRLVVAAQKAAIKPTPVVKEEKPTSAAVARSIEKEVPASPPITPPKRKRRRRRKKTQAPIVSKPAVEIRAIVTTKSSSKNIPRKSLPTQHDTLRKQPIKRLSHSLPTALEHGKTIYLNRSE